MAEKKFSGRLVAEGEVVVMHGPFLPGSWSRWQTRRGSGLNQPPTGRPTAVSTAESSSRASLRASASG